MASFYILPKERKILVHLKGNPNLYELMMFCGPLLESEIWTQTGTNLFSLPISISVLVSLFILTSTMIVMRTGDNVYKMPQYGVVTWYLLLDI